MKQQWKTFATIGEINLIRVSSDGYVGCSTCIDLVYSKIDPLKPTDVRPVRGSRWPKHSASPTANCVHVNAFLREGRFVWGTGPGGLKYPIFIWKSGGETSCMPDGQNNTDAATLLAQALNVTTQHTAFSKPYDSWLQISAVVLKRLFEQGYDLAPRVVEGMTSGTINREGLPDIRIRQIDLTEDDE